MNRRIRWGRVWIAVGVAAVLLLGIAWVAGQIIREEKERGREILLQELMRMQDALADEPDFIRMKTDVDGLRLYMTDGTERLTDVPPEMLARFDRPWWDEYRLAGGWKRGDDVFFITGGAVDDCWGYVISDDDGVCVDGLMQLQRAGGSAWYFSTMAK